MKPRFSQYLDGFIVVYEEKPERKTNFNATQNVIGLQDMNIVVKLAFEEKSKRVQDLEFAQQNDFSLSLKVKCRLFSAVKNKQKAVINNYLYNVSYVDYDKMRKEMYLYLEGVRPIVK